MTSAKHEGLGRGKKRAQYHIFPFCNPFLHCAPIVFFLVERVWVQGGISTVLYSCFEKGCPTKPYATMPKGIVGNEGLWSLIEALGVSTT